MYPLLSIPPGSEWILILLIFFGILIICYRAGFNHGKREGERTQLQRQVDQIRKKQTIETDSIQPRSNS
jgi:hypothetical protein